jgi:hypothetical protein
MKQKSLDRKLAVLRANPDANEFILADAKDADMAFGVGAPGKSTAPRNAEAPYRSLAEFRDIIREIVRQELVDIMLMSASTSDVLAVQERLFDDSPVTPAVRANDTTDIHAVRGGKYVEHPAMPFRTATVDHIQCGHIDCAPAERRRGADLGLYSVTFNNDPVRDRQTLEEYNRFRIEAERKGFRHFLEVFDPNVPGAVAPELLPKFINDMIARCLAGVPQSGRPLFLKMVYHGPQAMEELHRYDPSLVIGILGGSAGTTYDAFKLLAEAKKYGARVALFGRKINSAENQFVFLRFLRLIAQGQVAPEDGVRAYHAALARLGVRPHRALEADLRLETGVMSYGGSARSTVPPARAGALERRGGNERPAAVPAATAGGDPPQAHACRCHGDAAAGGGADGEAAASAGVDARSRYAPRPASPAPDFSRMTPAEKLAYHKAERDRVFG